MNELNCSTSFYQNDPFESNIIVSSNTNNFSDNFVLSEVIGKLGSICNSGEISPNSFVDSNNNSCYTTPMSSPPRLNLANFPSYFASNNLESCKLSRISRNMCIKENEFGDSRENSSVCEQIPIEEIGIKCQNDANSMKGKSIPKRKAKEIIAKNENVINSFLFFLSFFNAKFLDFAILDFDWILVIYTDRIKISYTIINLHM